MPQRPTFVRIKAGPGTFSADGRTVRLADLQPSALPLARGHFRRPPPAELLVACGPAGRPRAVFARDPIRRLVAQIWPPYDARLSHRRERIRARTAVTDREVAEARAFIAEIHPRGAAPAGMFVTLHSLDEDQDPHGTLVAAAQIGAYYHVSLPGRAAFASRLLGRRCTSLGRAALIQAVPISAGVRYAVRTDRQGGRLGDVLARQVLTVAANYRWPPARVIEVSRHAAAKTFAALCNGLRQDFLTRACYIPVPLPHRRANRRLSSHEPASDRPIPTYYYADVSGRPRPAAIAEALAVGARPAVRSARR